VLGPEIRSGTTPTLPFGTANDKPIVAVDETCLRIAGKWTYLYRAVDREKKMTESIRVGTMLLRDGTKIPKGLAVTTERYSAGWSFITRSTSAQLNTEVESVGWTLFYMAGEIHTRSFGFDDLSRTDRAVAKLISAVRRDSCNCLEITALKRGSFLGLPYTSLIAHSRHIQRGRIFA
jgi:DDE domain